MEAAKVFNDEKGERASTAVKEGQLIRQNEKNVIVYDLGSVCTCRYALIGVSGCIWYKAGLGCLRLFQTHESTVP